MDIAVKQRILGGFVLLAGAALFLPMLLEGSGVKALQPPELPAAPVTPTTADLAPPLQEKAREIEAGVAASHGDPTFYDVPPPQDAPAAAPTPAVPEQFHVVSPAPDKTVPAAAAAAQAVAPVPAPAPPKPVTAPAPVAERAVDKAAAEQAARAAKAQADKLAADKAAAAKKVADARIATDRLAAEKARADKLAADQKAAEAKAAADKAARAAVQDPDPALPQAWVVQAGNFAARDKAQALVDKLRAKGFRASLAGKDGGWRVIIGPELDKSLAEAAKKRLAADADLKLSGWIQAYRP